MPIARSEMEAHSGIHSKFQIATTQQSNDRSFHVSRLNAKVRCNYYPLPLREAERIRNLLRFPIEPFSALDPCVGDGAAFAAITRDSSARRYGIELDAYRAEQAGPSHTKIVQGNCLETDCAIVSLSPYICNRPTVNAHATHDR